jgi:hypothetical protein
MLNENEEKWLSISDECVQMCIAVTHNEHSTVTLLTFDSYRNVPVAISLLCISSPARAVVLCT